MTIDERGTWQPTWPSSRTCSTTTTGRGRAALARTAGTHAPAALELIDEVEAQHGEIDAALEEVGASRTAWVADPDGARRDLLADRLERLSTLLRGHLDLEERALLPLAAMVLTRTEWLAVGEAGAAAIPKRLLPLTFGMFAYEGDPDVISDMLAAAPLIPRTLMPWIAPRVYARRARVIHGTPRP